MAIFLKKCWRYRILELSFGLGVEWSINEKGCFALLGGMGSNRNFDMVAPSVGFGMEFISTDRLGINIINGYGYYNSFDYFSMTAELGLFFKF